MALKTAANGVVQREDLTCHEGLFFGNRVGVPTISFLEEIRTAVGETLGGAGTTGVPGNRARAAPLF